MCKDDYGIDVTVVDAGSTVWIYMPLSLTDEEGKYRMDEDRKWDPELAQEMRYVYQSIGRVFLSMDRRPDFYCLIRTNTKDIGIDW